MDRQGTKHGIDRRQLARPYGWLARFHTLNRYKRFAEAEDASVYFNPCLGIPPITIDVPAHFFGVQMLVGAASLLVLLLVS